MKKFIFVLLLLFVGCTGTKDDDTRRILEAQGFTNIEITGYRWTGCGEDDNYHTGFKAKAPITNKEVTGVVCSNWSKSSTVRFD